MKLHSKDGVEMMAVTAIERDGDKLVIKGKMMKTMPANIIVKPEDLAEGLSLLSLRMFFSIPVLLVKGLWRKWRAPKEQ